MRPLFAALLILCLLIVLYLGSTLGVFAFQKYHQRIPKVTYDSVLLPHRWGKNREAKGDHYIETGKRALLDGEIQVASRLVHAGLRLAPANPTGRLVLAQIYTDSKRDDLAEACLGDGLPFHSQNPTYLAHYLGFLIDQKQDATVLNICRRLLPLLPEDTERDRLLTLAAATACYFRGNLEQAEDYIRIGNLKSQRAGKLLSAKIAWDQGRRELALIEFRELQILHPKDPEIYSELTTRLRESSRTEEAHRLALSFQIENPDQHQPRLDLIRHFRDREDHARARQEVEELILAAPNKQLALLALGDFAASNGDSALASSLKQKARSLNLDVEPLLLLAIEADISAGDYQNALNKVKALHSSNPDLTKAQAPLLNSFAAIAHFGLGEPELGELALAKLLDNTPSRAPHLLKIAERLLVVSAIDPAVKVLSAAIKADPLNQAALARLVSIELAHYRTAELPAHLHLLLATRRPSPDLLRVAHHQLGSDAFLFIPDRSPLLQSIRAQLTAAELQQRRFN